MLMVTCLRCWHNLISGPAVSQSTCVSVAHTRSPFTTRWMYNCLSATHAPLEMLCDGAFGLLGVALKLRLGALFRRIEEGHAYHLGVNDSVIG